MAKIIKYRFPANENNPDVEQILLEKSIHCSTQEQFDVNYPVAEKEAIAGTIEVSGEFDTEQDNASTDDVLNALLGVTV